MVERKVCARLQVNGLNPSLCMCTYLVKKNCTSIEGKFEGAGHGITRPFVGAVSPLPVRVTLRPSPTNAFIGTGPINQFLAVSSRSGDHIRSKNIFLSPSKNLFCSSVTVSLLVTI